MEKSTSSLPMKRREINNAINSESVEMGEIIGELQQSYLKKSTQRKKYRYSNYFYSFNQKVDDDSSGNQSNDIQFDNHYTIARLRF